MSQVKEIPTPNKAVPSAASVSLAGPIVGDENNRSVKIVATPSPENCLLYWTVIRGKIPAGHKGGLGPSTLIFSPGSLDPGTYNVACHAVNPEDNTTSDSTTTFTIPMQPVHLVPAP
jgi:hypothetical protein